MSVCYFCLLTNVFPLSQTTAITFMIYDSFMELFNKVWKTT